MIATCQRVRDLAPGFVLGALEPDEMLAVREHLEECDQPHPEITELGGVVSYLAQVVEPVEPPESLKTAIVAAARADLAERHRRDKAAERLVATLGSGSGGRPRTVPSPQPSPAASSEIESAAEPPAVPAPGPSETSAPVVSLDSVRARRNRILRMVVGIAAAFAIVVGGLGWANAYIDAQRAKEAADEQKAITNRLMDILHGGPQDSASVTLTSPIGGTASGYGFLMPSGHLGLSLTGLPPLKGDEVFEVWLVSGRGEAVDGGFVEANGAPTATYIVTSPAVATTVQVLITIEHGRDAKTPSQPPILSGTLGT